MVFVTDGTERDPVAVLFARKRPKEINLDELPGRKQHFKAGKTRSLKTGWLKSGAAGVNKLNRSMKTMVQKAGRNSKRHSSRHLTLLKYDDEHGLSAVASNRPTEALASVISLTFQVVYST